MTDKRTESIGTHYTVGSEWISVKREEDGFPKWVRTEHGWKFWGWFESCQHAAKIVGPSYLHEESFMDIVDE